jgi:hypothetical protein
MEDLLIMSKLHSCPGLREVDFGRHPVLASHLSGLTHEYKPPTLLEEGFVSDVLWRVERVRLLSFWSRHPGSRIRDWRKRRAE